MAAHESGAPEPFDDGAVAFADGSILATGPYAEVVKQHPDAEVIDRRDCFLLPGLVDTHVHYPQIPVIGAMGLELLDWLTENEKLIVDDAHHRAHDLILDGRVLGTEVEKRNRHRKSDMRKNES